jgi:hypothetical protein
MVLSALVRWRVRSRDCGYLYACVPPLINQRHCAVPTRKKVASNAHGLR